jgi:alanine racemase
MDVTVIDVTPVADVKLGDQVILLGSSDHCSVSAWEHADLENTIPYEVLCRVGRRVPREYLL